MTWGITPTPSQPPGRCQLAAAYCTTTGCVPKKFKKYGQLALLSLNYNPVWAHNSALLSESRKRGQSQVWSLSLNSEFHVAKRGKNNLRLCARVSGCPGDVRMRSWVCPTSASHNWQCSKVSDSGVFTSKEYRHKAYNQGCVEVRALSVCSCKPRT